MRRTVFNEDHEAFREMVRDFIAKEVVPSFHEWEEAGAVPRAMYRRLGELGIFGTDIPEEYGGAGQHGFRYQAVFLEETQYACVSFGGYSGHNVVMPYLLSLGTEEQKQRWLPGCVSGELMTAVAMTEPGTGSDLSGIQTSAKLSEDGTHWVLNGAKTFITGGSQADLVLVVCRTSPATAEDRRAGLSILCVDTTSEGFAVGRKLQKIGVHASDTAELSFSDVRVPAANLLGEAGKAFSYLTRNLAHERLVFAVNGVASARAALRLAVDYTKDRKVFGKSVASFQNTKFVLAECAAEIEAAQAMVDKAIELHSAREFTAEDAAKAKLFCTETAGRVIDKCLQLHGGYGYIREYPIARLYADTRVSRVYGGTSEIMKIVIARSLGL
ncbi:acyl-CoA dehydrogenase family protein [Streptomyces sp. NPDC051940]|uniref:acyl-CoA dehydrogenase family protein n=1 Tax=Streptomyces sp. NPDC051940 TaxID=3155675 RepID=UPI00342BE11C